jgi:hypothetical protein
MFLAEKLNDLGKIFKNIGKENNFLGKLFEILRLDGPVARRDARVSWQEK